MIETTKARDTGKVVVTIACASLDEARKLARSLVEKRLAACAQIVPQVESVYWWKGQVESSAETLLLVKTARTRWDSLCAEIRALHSYEVPEILALPVESGSAAYLEWMDGELDA